MTPGPDGATICIPLSEYAALQKDSMFLAALEAAGVDNWSGYDMAVELYRETPGVEDDEEEDE